MRNLLRRFIDYASIPGDVQFLWGLFMMSGITGAGAGLLAYVNEQPHWAMLIGFGVAAFIASLIYNMQRFYREQRIYRGIRIDRIEPYGISANNETRKIIFPMKVLIKNTTQREVFFRVTRADLVLQGKTTPEKLLLDQIGSIQSGGTQAFRLASIPNITIDEKIEGRLEMQIEYGGSEKSMRYLLTHKYNPSIDFPGGIPKKDDAPQQVPITLDGHSYNSTHAKTRLL